MIGVDAGRDAEGLCIRGVASLGVGRGDTAENEEWARSRRVKRSRRRVVGGQWNRGSRNARDARPAEEEEVGGGREEHLSGFFHGEPG